MNELMALVGNDGLVLIVTVVAILGGTATYAFVRKKKAEQLKGKQPPKELPAEKAATEPVEELAQKPEETKVKSSEEVKEATKEISLDDALKKTRSGFFGRIKGLFSGGGSLSADQFEELEEILYTSDLGPQTVQRLMSGIDDRLAGAEKSDFDSVRSALRDEMFDIFGGMEGAAPLAKWQQSNKTPLVLMIVGVNGAGKTTTIGKLALRLAESGKKVMVAAGDTFRAAAEDQLKVWSERARAEIYSPPGVKDPSAVAFDACKLAESKGVDALIIDTAGRLHTQSNLMEELKKMKRVVKKVFPDAPHEVLLVLDANSGQNALIQAQSFNQALDVTGVILTKLDGTAKGGVAVGVACELQLPICLIGVGEGINDLRPFSADEFVDSIL